MTGIQSSVYLIPYNVLCIGENVVEFFNRIAVITFENAIIREMGTLKQTEVAHAVAERSTIISMPHVFCLSNCMHTP